MIRILLLICLVLSSCGTTKEISPESEIHQAEYFTKRGQYSQAKDIYLRLISDKKNYNRSIVGLIELYQLTDNRKEAISILETEYSKKENPFLSSALASLYRKEGDLSKSLHYYENYIDNIGPEHKNYNQAKRVIEEISFALELLNNPLEINAQKMDVSINTENSEYSPNFTINDKRIVFTRKVHNQEDLFEATWDGTAYIVSPMSAINTKYNEGAQAVSGDGTLIIFTHCNEDFGYGSCDLYESIRENGVWQKPQNLGPIINTSAWETHPSLTPNGNVLYFASNRPGGKGKSDIWMSKKDLKGKWLPPTNLGPKINTVGNDDSPFIHADERSLYFRSDGYKGIGGFDIFLSQKANGQWTSPTNLGSPINSTGHDGNLVVSLDGTKGFFASDKDNDNLDIYQFDLPIQFRPYPMTYVEGVVLSYDTKKTIPATITITDLSTQEIVHSLSVDSSGSFLIAVPVSTTLSMHVRNQDYVFHSSNISFSEVRTGQEPYKERIALLPLIDENNTQIVDVPVVLKNIFFESNSDFLLPISTVEIAYLTKLLEENNELTITIIGHTDNVGNAIDNLDLSLRRAKAVKNAIVKRGIDSNRMITIGKGETMPIASNDTAEGRSINRRTTFVINKE